MKNILKKVALYFSLGILLANFYGYIFPLKTYLDESSKVFHKNKIPLLEAYSTKVDLKKIDLKNISEKDLREINYLFAGSVKHYWPTVNLFEFSENWIIFFLQRIELQTKTNKTLKLERFNWEKIIERGYGFCSQISLAMYDFFRKNNLNSLILSLGGHVVIEFKDDDKSYILDPDYNVVINADLNSIYANPDVIEEAYMSAGYNRNNIEILRKIYTSRENNMAVSRYDYLPKLTKFYYLVNLLKWLIPILIIMLLKKNEISRKKK